jgi:hypothetical protein
MENKNNVTVVGGSVGWGGLVDTNGDRLIPANASSDCLNVFEDNGVLYKRNGYTSENSLYVNSGSYTSTSTGQTYLNCGTANKLSQEIYLSGLTTGVQNAILGFCIKRGSVTDNIVLISIYASDASGHPTGIALYTSGSKFINSYALKTTEQWYYHDVSSVNFTTKRLCLVLETGNTFTGECVGWMYSNAGGGYAPGGARVAAYYNGAAWVDIAGVDFKFKFYTVGSAYNVKKIFQYTENSTNFYSDAAVFTNTQQLNFGSYIPESTVEGWCEGYTVFAENDINNSEVLSSRATSNIDIFPVYTGTAGIKNMFLNKDKVIIAADYGIFKSAFNNKATIISSYGNPNSEYCMENTPYGMCIFSDGNVPEIWGSASYPILGDTGPMSFSGLTNPITKAKACMWHKSKMFVGNVTINGVAYPNRIYRSGVNTPEAGYSDTDFLTLDGPVMAMINCGDYAILASAQSTYLLLNGSLAATSIEQVQHDIAGGISSYNGMCIYKGSDASLKVYGISDRGIFEIDRYVKTFIHANIKDKMANWILAKSFICPDYQRDSVIVGFKELTTRKILTYNVISKTWYMEDTDVDGMFSMTVGNSAIPVIYGFKGSKIMRMYTGTSDDGNFIKAYYKTGPLYINDTKYKPRNIFAKYKNESTVSHLDIKYSKDYAADVTKTIQNGNASVTSNVPYIKKIDCGGEASSIEVTLYQDKITTTVNATSASGAPTLYVASITGFIVGHKIIINDGGAREEVGVISAIGSTYLTLVGNLTYSHTLAQADVVDTYDESFAVASVDLELYGSNKVPQDL